MCIHVCKCTLTLRVCVHMLGVGVHVRACMCADRHMQDLLHVVCCAHVHA